MLQHFLVGFCVQDNWLSVDGDTRNVMFLQLELNRLMALPPRQAEPLRANSLG